MGRDTKWMEMDKNARANKAKMAKMVVKAKTAKTAATIVKTDVKRQK